jgi:nucleoside-diphosphate-sugar epimerase
MRVFISGASGAIGTRLVPQLVAHGHEVIGTFRASPEKGQRLRALGAEAVSLNLLDAAAVRKAVLDAKPDAIIHEATALGGRGFSRKLDRTFADTNRLRTEGTDALLAAAAAAQVPRFVAQSFAPYAAGARPPRHMPAWLARLVAGEDGVRMATQTRGASNAKAKRELGWTLRYPSWRAGFAAAYGAS